MRRVRPWIALLLTGVMALAAGCGGGAQQQQPSGNEGQGEAKTWAPSRQVEMIVPYSAGGSTDLLARAVEKVWPKYVDQPLVIVNKTGAGGYEGRSYVAQGKKDGHILMMGYGSGEDLTTPQLRTVNVDPFKDLVGVARLSIHSILVAVPANSEIDSIGELVEWAKQTGQPVTAAVSTAAGSVDLVMRGIGNAAGIEVTPVPHAGGSQAVATLVGGQTMMGGGHPSEIMPHVKAGRLKVIGVATPDRDPSVPDVPTLIEQGVDFYTWGSVKGIAVAAGTPQEAIDYWEDVFKKICEDEEFKAAMAELQQPIQYLNSKDFNEFMRQAYADYGEVIKKLNISIQ